MDRKKDGKVRERKERKKQEKSQGFIDVLAEKRPVGPSSHDLGPRSK